MEVNGIVKSGDKIGRLLILRRSDRNKDAMGRYRKYWICQCDCGNITEKRSDSFSRDPVPSCGCYGRERSREFMKEFMSGKNKYGDSRERIHNIWYLMKYRCEDPSSPAFHNYGGRGIAIYPEWSDGIDGYFKFKEWALSNGYQDNLSLDRINNDDGYTPNNCRWVDRYTQANNKRSNTLYEMDGETKTLAQWAREYGMNYKLVHARIKRGWSLEDSLTIQSKKSHNIA